MFLKGWYSLPLYELPQLGRYLIGGYAIDNNDCECSVSWLDWFTCFRNPNFYDIYG